MKKQHLLLPGRLPLLLFRLLLGGHFARAQSVGIGTTTPAPKAALDISATDKGLLLPRRAKPQRLALSASTGATPPGLTTFQTERSSGTGRSKKSSPRRWRKCFRKRCSSKPAFCPTCTPWPWPCGPKPTRCCA